MKRRLLPVVGVAALWLCAASHLPAAASTSISDEHRLEIAILPGALRVLC